MSSDEINFIFFPRKLFLDKKNKLAGFARPNSFNPIMVKLYSLLL
jgi:hypothetical protein